MRNFKQVLGGCQSAPTDSNWRQTVQRSFLQKWILQGYTSMLHGIEGLGFAGFCILGCCFSVLILCFMEGEF